MVRNGITRRGVWALAGGLVFAGIPVVAVASERHAFGPHPHQRLQIFRGSGVGQHPLVLMAGGISMTPQARRLAARGMTVAVVEKPRAAYGFNTATYELVSALEWLMARKESLDLDGRIAMWGEAQGASSALLVGRDRRYLQRLGMAPRDISGIVLVDEVQVTDATFTVPSAYGMSDPAAVFRIPKRKAADGAAFLSGLLGL